MIHDPHLLSYLQGLTVSLDPVERFRLAIGEPDAWQVAMMRTDPSRNQEDEMVLALCGRQSGKSTTAGGLGYDDFSRGKTVLLTAPSMRQSTELFRRILEYKHTDPFCPPIVRQTQTELEAHPRHGGRIVVLPATDQARGMTADTIIIDEAAFIDDDAMTAFFPMLTKGGRIFLLTTPNLREGLFYDTWSDKRAKVRRITARTVDVPRRTEEVERDRRTMPEAKFRREHLCEFIGAGTPLVSWEALEAASNKEVHALCLT